jgi:hypothetical protein
MKKPWCPPPSAAAILKAAAKTKTQCEPKPARQHMSDQLAEDDPRLSFIALEQATIPPSGFIEHIKDKWWIIHPTKGVCFYKEHSPQCNSNEKISKRFLTIYPWAELRYIPSVFRTVDPRDYV